MAENSRQTIFEKLLSLLRNELWGEPLAIELTATDAAEVLQLARYIQVGGLVADAIVRNALPIGEDMTMEVFGVKQRHEKNGLGANGEVSKFAEFLNRRHLAYRVMKGQTYAALYPNPLARSCGDIDFYCPPSSYQQVQQTIEQRLGIVMKHNCSEKHDNFDIEGFPFEMHSMLTRFSYSRHQRYWETLTAKELDGNTTSVDIHGCQVSVLPPTLNAIYVFSHLLEHFVESSIGLKQLCDWAMVLHHYRDEIDRQALEQHLKNLGILRAYRRMGAWLVGQLGLPAQDFPIALSHTDHQWARHLTENILYWVEKRQRMTKIQGRVSLRHSLRTAGIVVEQSFRFFRLAPMEMLMRIPQMASWSVRKRMID